MKGVDHVIDEDFTVCKIYIARQSFFGGSKSIGIQFGSLKGVVGLKIFWWG